MMMQSTSANISSMQSQLDSTNQFISQKSLQRIALTKTISDLEKQADAAKKADDKIKTSIDTITNNQEMITGDLLLALSGLSPTINLTSISESGSVLIIEGESPNENEVQLFSQAILQYARTLDQSKRYSESTITALVVRPPEEATNGQNQDSESDGSIEFTLTFERAK
jgi:hypothetical protein